MLIELHKIERKFILNVIYDVDNMVDVIIPTYNRAGTIIQSIKSVLSQSFQALHVYVIDDASTDGTERIIAENISDKRVTYYKCKTNKGANACRNIGIKMGRAEYVAFNDSDDLWHEDKLEKQMKIMLEDKQEIGVVFSDYERVISEQNTYNCLERMGFYEEQVDDFHKRLLKSNVVSTQTMLIKRKCLNEVGYFDEQMPRLQDWELSVRLSQKYNFKFIPEVLVKAYLSENSITNNASALARAYMRVLVKYYEEYVKYDMLDEILVTTQNACIDAGVENEYILTLQQIGLDKIGSNALSVAIEKLGKFKINYNIASHWIEYLSQGKNIHDYFMKNGFKNIAIFGYGVLGKALFNYLQSSLEIKIKAIIDNGYKDKVLSVPLYTEDEYIGKLDQDIDVMIVTVQSCYIRLMHNNKNYPIIDIEKLFI